MRNWRQSMGVGVGVGARAGTGCETFLYCMLLHKLGWMSVCLVWPFVRI